MSPQDVCCLYEQWAYHSNVFLLTIYIHFIASVVFSSSIPLCSPLEVNEL